MKKVDITVIGSGINATSVAAEAASRGLTTLLVSSGDLASNGSSPPVTLAGTHLEHLSALDYFQLNGMLEELERLSRSAPHLVDFLHVISAPGTPLKEGGCGIVEKYLRGVRDKCFARFCDNGDTHSRSYGARVKPARLVVCKALQAQKFGATVWPYHTVTEAIREKSCWQLTLTTQNPNQTDTQEQKIISNIVVNCGGWWANGLLDNVLKASTRCRATEEHRTQFFFRNPGLTLEYGTAGNAVLKLEDSADKAFYVYAAGADLLAFGPRKCDQQGYDECVDLLQSFIDCWNNNLAQKNNALQLSKDHFVHKRKALIALIADPCSHSDSPMTAPLLDLNNPGKAAVLLNVFGVDTVLHRKMAQQAMDVLRPFTQKKANQHFAADVLPGGDLHTHSVAVFIKQLRLEFPELPPAMLSRMARCYGSLTYSILGSSHSLEAQGQHFGNHLYENEVRYLMRQEWATCAEDIIWRRSFIGVEFSEKQAETLQNWIRKTIN